MLVPVRSAFGKPAVLIEDMSDAHLINSIKRIRRQCKEGYVHVTAVGGYYEHMVYGDKAAKVLHLDQYLEEARKRNLTEIDNETNRREPAVSGCSGDYRASVQ